MVVVCGNNTLSFVAKNEKNDCTQRRNSAKELFYCTKYDVDTFKERYMSNSKSSMQISKKISILSSSTQ